MLNRLSRLQIWDIIKKAAEAKAKAGKPIQNYIFQLAVTPLKHTLNR